MKELIINLCKDNRIDEAIKTLEHINATTGHHFTGSLSQLQKTNAAYKTALYLNLYTEAQVTALMTEAVQTLLAEMNIENYETANNSNAERNHKTSQEASANIGHTFVAPEVLQHEYNRNRVFTIGFIILAIGVGGLGLQGLDDASVLSGLEIVSAIILLIYGFWGMMTPYVQVGNDFLKINYSPFRSFDVSLKDIISISGDINNEQLEVIDRAEKSYAIKLYGIRKSWREQFVQDMKQIIS